jgi:hypothetical protein
LLVFFGVRAIFSRAERSRGCLEKALGGCGFALEENFVGWGEGPYLDSWSLVWHKDIEDPALREKGNILP